MILYIAVPGVVEEEEAEKLRDQGRTGETAAGRARQGFQVLLCSEVGRQKTYKYMNAHTQYTNTHKHKPNQILPPAVVQNLKTRVPFCQKGIQKRNDKHHLSTTRRRGGGFLQQTWYIPFLSPDASCSEMSLLRNLISFFFPGLQLRTSLEAARLLA